MLGYNHFKNLYITKSITEHGVNSNIFYDISMTEEKWKVNQKTK